MNSKKTPSPSPTFWIPSVLSSTISFPRHTLITFPAYRYLPGVNAHPIRDPKGHSYQKKESPLTAEESYLYGVDLWNHAYWWECHEVFESLWKISPKKSPKRLFFQGWIQFAAAFIQWTLGKPQGVRSLFESAASKWESLPQHVSIIKGVRIEETLKLLSIHFLKGRDLGSHHNPLENYPHILLDKTFQTS